MFPYEEKINLAIRKFAFDKSEDAKEDLRQECALAILEAGGAVTGPDIAYLISRNTVIKSFRKGLGAANTDSLTEQSVLNKADSLNYVFPDYGFLDVEIALNKLPEDEAEIIQLRYGIGCMELTQEETARALYKSQEWVSKQEKYVLGKLQELLKEK